MKLCKRDRKTFYLWSTVEHPFEGQPFKEMNHITVVNIATLIRPITQLWPQSDVTAQVNGHKGEALVDTAIHNNNCHDHCKAKLVTDTQLERE